MSVSVDKELQTTQHDRLLTTPAQVQYGQSKKGLIRTQRRASLLRRLCPKSNQWHRYWQVCHQSFRSNGERSSGAARPEFSISRNKLSSSEESSSSNTCKCERSGHRWRHRYQAVKGLAWRGTRCDDTRVIPGWNGDGNMNWTTTSEVSSNDVLRKVAAEGSLSAAT